LENGFSIPEDELAAPMIVEGRARRGKNSAMIGLSIYGALITCSVLLIGLSGLMGHERADHFYF